MTAPLSPPAGSPGPQALAWDRRYREGNDGWELGAPAPPLATFLRGHPLAPRPPGRVLVPGCGRGHEARLLAELGFEAVGVDISAEALREARRLHGDTTEGLSWCQADVLDAASLAEAGLPPGHCHGVLEHTSFCAIDPDRRPDWIAAVVAALVPGGWLLGLFWCHRRPGGPPFGADPEGLAERLEAAGLVRQLWQPAEGSACGRDGSRREDEWIGLWRRGGSVA